MNNYVYILPKITETQARNQVAAQTKRRNRLYICTECETNFSSHNALKAHEKECPTSDNATSKYNICKYCNALYASLESLTKHLDEEHADGKYVCRCCEKRLACKGHLRNHAMKAHGYKALQYYCTLCKNQTRFDGKSDIGKHFSQEHEVCSTTQSASEMAAAIAGDCNEDDDNVEMLDLEWLDDCLDSTYMSLSTTLEALDFDWDNVLNSVGDIRTTTPTSLASPGVSFTCPICDCACSKALALIKHVDAEHKTISALACVYCKREFDKLINYKRHLERMHTLLPKHECFFCQRLFSSMDHLKKHVLSLHQNERRFNCIHCDATFMQSGHLKQHLETHTRVKRFNCSRCLRSFWRAVDLARHKCKDRDGS